ncbi:hypothetical protein DRQ36_04450 [bacterium]|nr:MAG: hypothetical protein DRQ36_04450 [bacterium]
MLLFFAGLAQSAEGREQRAGSRGQGAEEAPLSALRIICGRLYPGGQSSQSEFRFDFVAGGQTTLCLFCAVFGESGEIVLSQNRVDIHRIFFDGQNFFLQKI